MGPTAYKPLKTRASEAWGALKTYLDDEKMAQFPLLVTLSHKIDRPPSVLAHSFLLALLSVLLLNPYNLSGIIVNSLAHAGLVWSSYSYLATLSGDVNHKASAMAKPAELWPSSTRRLMDYWVVYSTSIFLESTLGEDTLVALVPLWWAFKGLAVVWVITVSKERKERPKPKPLKLEQRSTVATTRTPQTFYADQSSSPSTASLSTGVTTALDSGPFSGPGPISSQLREIKRDLSDLSREALSKTPENLKHKTGPAETPVSGESEGESEPFGLSGNSDTGSDSESNSSSSDSDSGSESDNNSSGPGSAATDDSNDDLLPPGTALDSQTLEVAGAEKPEAGNDELDTKENQDALEEQASGGADKLETITAATEPVRSVPEDAEAIASQSVPQLPHASRDLPVPSPSAPLVIAEQEDKLDSLSLEHTPAQNLDIQEKTVSPVLAPIAGSLNVAAQSPKVVDDEGSITRLTLEDLLAMEGRSDDEMNSAGMALESGKDVEERVEIPVVAKGVEPLNIIKPLAKKVGTEAKSLL
ncbi:hypothetical protein L202_07975 [Cryptococcus amylolentus CBS 6039]|uniref:Uncharacterized protein n=2 Tax=Cryptococcus amylolentus TaxID=104669 RepID=A0A1E3HAV9_9TREE|nr:hypothetical protein L202_07975 [Cryptococcus amylolentus CBS 6039]ODN73463.1 hypothetical protein L202_07975 [Cryptococcus amylolentus CBS 6039]ODN99222.1 hypothetical protein I350_07381 [Cryptococcus amylolentus CBS 6273]